MSYSIDIEMIQTIAMYAKQWDVSDSEAANRLLQIGAIAYEHRADPSQTTLMMDEAKVLTVQVQDKLEEPDAKKEASSP